MRARGALALGCALVASPQLCRAEDDPWLARDKALHFSACTIIAASGYGVASVWWERPWARALAGGGLSLGVGAAKEGADALGLGDPSWRDFTWDAAGAATGVGIAYAVDWLVHRLRDPRRAGVRAGAPLRF
jgi:putative lipoprotein